MQSNLSIKPATGNITVVRSNTNFEMIPAAVIDDNDSFTVGVYCKVLRLGRSWNLNINGLASMIGVSGRILRGAIVSLESEGFIRRVPVRQGNGQLCGWDYEFYDAPVPEERRTRAGKADKAESRQDGKPTCRETDLTENRQVGKAASQYIQTETTIQTENNKQTENINIQETLSKDREKKSVEKSEYAPSVFLTEAEHQKLADEMKEDLDGMLEYYSNYKIDKKYKNTSDYLSIKRWGISGYYENKSKNDQAKRKAAKNDNSELLKRLDEEHDRAVKEEMAERERKRKAAEELEKRVATMSEYEKLYYEYRKTGLDKWDAKLKTDNTFPAPGRLEKAKNTPWQQSEFSFIREGFRK